MGTDVLVTTPDRQLATGLRELLAVAGYGVRCVGDAPSAQALVRCTDLGLVLLDATPPELDGVELCRRIRADSPVPVILLSDRADEVDRVVAFEVGADDFVAKPFSERELVARIRAVLRRSWLCPEHDFLPAAVEFGEVRIDPTRHEVTRGGSPITLTDKEYRLLWLLVRNPRRVFTKQQILDLVWGPNVVCPTGRVPVQMRYLREKIEADPSNPRYLRTASRTGYRFDP